MQTNEVKTDVIFDRVVSTDGWFSTAEVPRRYNFSADVVFGKGVVGTEEESQVQFELSLTEADILVILPSTEPANILPSSISYDSPNIEFASKTVVADDSKGGTELGVNFDLSRGKQNAAFKAGGKHSRELTHLKETAVTQKHQSMQVLHSRTSSGDNRWTVSDGLNGQLIGRPWDPKSEPRLAIDDKRAKVGESLSIAITLQVQCDRRHLKILNIRLKSTSVWQKFVRSPFSNAKLKAACYKPPNTALFATKSGQAWPRWRSEKTAERSTCIST